MKKFLIPELLIPAIALPLLMGVMLLVRNNNFGNNLEELCRSSGGGWAPAGMDSGELQTIDGNRLSKDSPLIDREGYTCYCHTENTYWNGKMCTPATSSTTPSY